MKKYSLLENYDVVENHPYIELKFIQQSDQLEDFVELYAVISKDKTVYYKRSDFEYRSHNLLRTYIADNKKLVLGLVKIPIEGKREFILKPIVKMNEKGDLELL